MKSKAILYSLVLLLATLVTGTLHAQEEPAKKYKLMDKMLKKTQAKKASKHFKFTNIGLIDRYRDEAKLKNIAKLEEKGDQAKLILALEDYISRFGAENFSHEYQLMWKLAQLYEKQDRVEDAKWMYRLLLKHAESNLELIARYYDSLDVNDKDYYVPIKYYYELVDYRKQVDTLRPPEGILLNMGDSINSPFEDYGPSISPDNQTLLFGTKRNRRMIRNQEHINEDIYYSTREGENNWSKAIPLDGINTQYNEGAPCLSRDGKTLYFVRCETPEGFGRCDIYVAQKQDDGSWGNIKNLGPNVNTKDWDSHPTLSHTEDTLFFTSDRPGGFGSNDIYYTVKTKGGWGMARNMGPMINTKGNDISPFYHPKYDVFYFASNNQVLNFGNFDIFKTRMVNGEWEEPKNIGPLVNGTNDEDFFTIDAESKDLFYARTEGNNFNNTDLYSFPLPMEAQPLAYTVFQGSLTDSVTGEAFKGIVSVIDVDNGIEVAPKYIRPDGSFAFDLINNNKYLLIIQGEDFFRIEKQINLTGDTTIHFSTPSIKYYKLQFASVQFATNSAEVTDSMKPDLEKLMNFLLDNPTVHLVISGHTDSKGDPIANTELSLKRATSIRDYILTKGGINEFRIDAKGFGSTKPIIKDEQTEEDRNKNRRVEFELERPEEEKKQ